MIYPNNFEKKIGFAEIRTLLKGRCLSTLGTEWVERQLHFMTSFDEVNQALAEARDFIRFQDESLDEIEDEIFDVREALLHVRPERTYLEELDLFNLKRSTQTTLSYVDAFTKLLDDSAEETLPTADDDVETTVAEAEVDFSKYVYPALARMSANVAKFPDIVRRIDAVLNKYGKVKDTASPTLLTVRHDIELTIRSISHSLRSIISEAQTAGYIDRDVAPTLRDGRLVIPVAPALKRKIKGIVHDESATGKTIFIEPAAVVEANNKIRELRAAERREIIRILQELTAVIRPHIPEILDSQKFLAHVDYLRALAHFSSTFECVIPVVSKYASIDWAQARHPLLQQSLSRHGGHIVPLDITLRQGERILLISGPNAGGKSVCLKTIGLLQYMLQCGMPVSASESSKPGIFSSIFIDIGDEQSLENDLSTYSSHLINMREFLRSANPKSLLLIDEFGGGTEPQIGGALAEAMLGEFVQKKAFGIITTHYQNLKYYADKTSSVVNGAMLYDRAKMQPLFLLQVGNPGSSFAIEIARKIGLPESVIQYASDMVGKDYVMSDKYLQDIVRDKLYWEKKRQNIHNREKQLDDSIAKYEREMSTFQQERRVVMAKAKAEAKDLLDSANSKIENTIRTIIEANAEKERTREVRQELQTFKEELQQTKDDEDRINRKIAKIQRRQQRRLEDKAQGKKRGTADGVSGDATAAASTAIISATKEQGPFRSGDTVRIKGQNTVGVIESVAGNTAKILFGVVYTHVALKRLEHCDAPKRDEQPKAYTFISKETRDAMHEKKLHFKPEIDIRGMRVDEALNVVSHFIDDAIQMEQSRVRILHGTGTGALRELVRNYLQTVPGVKTYRDEHVQFGGAGITVVELL